MNQTEALQDLVELKQPLEETIKTVWTFPFSTLETLYILKAPEVVTVLKKYIKEEVSGAELSRWADAIESREGIEYEDEFSDWISDTIFRLSSPEINEPITSKCVSKILDQLEPNQT